MKVLVTGGAGFIGSHIVEFLLENNIDTVVVDNLVTGHKYNIPSKVAFYHFDIRDPNIDKIFMVEKPDFVIHQAAQVSVQESVKQPFYDCSENVMATVNILQACIKYNVKKLFMHQLLLYTVIPNTYLLMRSMILILYHFTVYQN